MEFPDILYAEKLAQRVTVSLEKMEFYLVISQIGNPEDGSEALEYQRPNPDFDKPDRISLYGDHRITGEAYSKGVILPNIRELLPDYRIDIPESHYWYYHDFESLEMCIEDIVKFIETKLARWFETPDPNPAQVTRSAFQLSREEMKARLRGSISYLTREIALAQSQGITQLVEDYEYELENLKNSLADLDQDK